jgi:cyclophilin family peptidyl-prolyl cis-trans isomerase
MTINSQGITDEVIFELFTDLAPKTCENFLQLCQGFKNSIGEDVGYAGSEIHRIVNGMFI